MKKAVLVLLFFALIAASVFGGGGMELVNEQRIDLRQIDNITIRYRSDNIILFSHDSDTLIIKEYMTDNNSRYYANINTSGNNLSVEAGTRPNLSSSFRSKIEIYIPVSGKRLTVSTSSGRIEGEGNYTASSIFLESTSGRITVNSVNGDVNAASTSGRIDIKQVSGSLSARTGSGGINSDSIGKDAQIRTSSGRITIGTIGGNAAAESSSGAIRLEMVNGTADIRTSSGNVWCAVALSPGDVSIRTSSGGVTLGLPAGLSFNFSSRTANGRLTAPFSDQLFSPMSDRNTVQGSVGGGLPARNIDITTGSGSIQVNWNN